MPDLWRLVPTLQLVLGSKSPTYGAFFGAMVLGALIAGVVALIVGVPTLRLKWGLPRDCDTWGFTEIIRILIVNGGTLTNGAAGILGLPAFTTWQLVYHLCCHYNDLYH